jgi:hypothetical protein
MSWALAIAFLGVTIATIAQFNMMTSVQKSKYKNWLILSLLLIWIGTIIQIVNSLN